MLKHCQLKLQVLELFKSAAGMANASPGCRCQSTSGLKPTWPGLSQLQRLCWGSLAQRWVTPG